MTEDQIPEYEILELLPEKEAEQVARNGIQRHPSYVSGFVCLGRILVAKKNWKEAEETLQKATSLAPENILAQQLIAQVYLQQSRPKDALKSYKYVLFLNPQSVIAKKAVEKLESLTADEYEDEVFEMKKLSEERTPSARGQQSNELERQLSLIDAYIVRNDVARARELISQAQRKFSNNQALAERLQMVSEEYQPEQATEISPNLKRENLIREKKLKRLNFLLQRIKNHSNNPSNSQLTTYKA